jgi:tetrahydromethanopterin S-methyltransferase subunit B
VSQGKLSPLQKAEAVHNNKKEALQKKIDKQEILVDDLTNKLDRQRQTLFNLYEDRNQLFGESIRALEDILATTITPEG